MFSRSSTRVLILAAILGAATLAQAAEFPTTTSVSASAEPTERPKSSKDKSSSDGGVKIERERSLGSSEDDDITKDKRKVSVKEWDTKNGAGVTFKSESESKTETDNSEFKFKETVIGSVNFKSGKTAPYAYLERITKSKNVTEFLQNATEIEDVQKEETGAFATVAFADLVEVYANGSEAAPRFSLFQDPQALKYGLAAPASQVDGIWTASVVGSGVVGGAQPNLKLTFTFIVAETPVVLNVSGLTVSAGPNKFKTVLEIRGWSYSSPDTFLRLDMLLGLGSYLKHKGFDGSDRWGSTDGMSFDTQKKAAYGDSRQVSDAAVSDGVDASAGLLLLEGEGPVSTSGFPVTTEHESSEPSSSRKPSSKDSIDDDSKDDYERKLGTGRTFKGKYGPNASIRKVSVQFQRNDVILYDPGLIAGAVASDTTPTNDGSSSAPSAPGLRTATALFALISAGQVF